jgi:hypothetical protein
MRTVELWRWHVTDPVSGRKYTTRYALVEADALDLDPEAKRAPGTCELRQVPEGPHEHQYTGLGPRRPSPNA